MATKEDEELRGALSREITYEDNLYFMRSIMGAGIKTSQDTMDFLGDMRATSKAMSADNRRQIRALKGKDVMPEAERQSRVDAATAAANQRADQLGKEVASAVAMNPSRAAGAIQAAGREQSRMTGLAAAKAETRVDALEAAREGQRVEELLTREDAEMQRKQARTKAHYDAVGKGRDTLAMLLGSRRPRTRQAQLETERLSGKKKGEALTGKMEAIEAKKSRREGGFTAGQTKRRQEKYKRLGEKKAKAEASGTAAGKELDLLQRAKQAEEAARWARYTPFSLGAQTPKPLADWEKPTTGLSVPPLKYK